jgi:hypothetical protein
MQNTANITRKIIEFFIKVKYTLSLLTDGHYL